MTSATPRPAATSSSRPPQTVYLHIGLHKTGTTYLQNVLRANREGVRGQGVDFPGGPGEPVQAFAVWDLQGRRPRGVDDKRVGGSWKALVEAVNSSGLRSALISEERLSLANLRQVRTAVQSFPDSEVHVVITARDLARVVVSAWQEEVKNDQTWTWQEFADSVKDPGQLATSPARGFWMRQDLVQIAETWESAVPAERITIVTVPQSGTSPDLLLERFSSVVGIDPTALTEEPAWNNETVGVAATEVIRRLNERLGGRLNQRAYDKVIKLTVVKQLARRTDPARFALPAEEFDWVTERAEAMIEAVRARGYAVVGDLDELRPRQVSNARRPDDATESELLEAALDGFAMLAEQYAISWWARRRSAASEGGRAGDLASRARSTVFRGQRTAATLADKNPVAARALGFGLAMRDRARRRARDRARRREM